MVLTVGYDIENLTDPERSRKYHGPVKTDHYGRRVPVHAHGTINLDRQTSSTKLIMDAVLELFERIVNPDLLIRRVSLVANHVVDEKTINEKPVFEQMSLFTDYEVIDREQKEKKEALDREKRVQNAVLTIKKRYGKNAILKGMNLQEGATTLDRNNQIGGHKA